jgi:hypothetical protein
MRLDDDTMTTVVPSALLGSVSVGNVMHMSPELRCEWARASRDRNVATLRFDKQPVFELGALAFETCCGERFPVRGYAERPDYRDADVDSVPVAAPGVRLGGYPQPWVDLCSAMVRRDPAARPSLAQVRRRTSWEPCARVCDCAWVCVLVFACVSACVCVSASAVLVARSALVFTA